MGGKCSKGDKGDSFVFDNFTPEQLERLRGPKGLPGEPGYGITSIVHNSDNTLTFYFGNDNTPFRTQPITGVQGEKGEKGETPIITVDVEEGKVLFKDGNRILRSMDTTTTLQSIEDEQENTYKNKFRFCNAQGECGDSFETPLYTPVSTDSKTLKLCLNGVENSGKCITKRTTGLDGISWQPRMMQSGDTAFMEFCPYNSSGIRITDMNCKTFPETNFRGPQGPAASVDMGTETSIANIVASTLVNQTNTTFFDALSGTLAGELSKSNATISKLGDSIFATYGDDLKNKVSDNLLKNNTFLSSISDGVFRNTTFGDTLQTAITGSSRELAPQIASILSGSLSSQDPISQHVQETFYRNMAGVIGEPIQCDQNKRCNVKEGNAIDIQSASGEQNMIRADGTQGLRFNQNTHMAQSGITTNRLGILGKGYISGKLFVGGGTRNPDTELTNMRGTNFRVYGDTDLIGNLNVHSNTLDPSTRIMTMNQSRPETTFFGNVSIKSTGQTFSLNDAELFLQNPENARFGSVRYSAVFDGPIISGRTGGALGLIGSNGTFQDVLTWDAQKNVRSASNIEVRGSIKMDSNQYIRGKHNLNISSGEIMYFLPNRTIISKNNGGSGNFSVTGDVNLSSGAKICLGANNTVCLDEISIEQLNGTQKMFKVQKYHGSGVIDLNESTLDWQHAVVTSMSTSGGDMDEFPNGSHIILCYCFPENGRWKLNADFKSHGSHELWDVWVLFMKDKWVESNMDWRPV